MSLETKAIAEYLVRYRSVHKLSQFEFASNCGISKDSVSLLEREQSNPTLDTLQTIAAYTNSTVAKLITYEKGQPLDEQT